MKADYQFAAGFVVHIPQGRHDAGRSGEKEGARQADDSVPGMELPRLGLASVKHDQVGYCSRSRP